MLKPPVTATARYSHPAVRAAFLREVMCLGRSARARGSAFLRAETRLDVPVGLGDDGLQWRGVQRSAWPELHVTAQLSGSLQETDGVRQRRAAEEPHVDMGPERVDVP